MDAKGDREIAHAAEIIGAAIVRLAHQRRDVRDALLTIARHIEPQEANESFGRRPVDERPEFAGGRPDLRLVDQRCQLKARACRWIVIRRDRLLNGADQSTAIQPTDDALLESARGHKHCELWMSDSRFATAPPEALELLASAYDNLACAAQHGMMIDEEGVDPNGPPPGALYCLVAESQSALLAAISNVGGQSDRDQQDVFHWLRDRTAEDRVFIERFMKRTDPAPFEVPTELRQRLETWRPLRQRVHAADQQCSQLVNKVRYHLAQLADDPLDDRLHHWRRVAESVESWLGIEGNGGQAGDADAGPRAALDRELRHLIATAPESLPLEIEISPKVRGLLDAVRIGDTPHA